MKRALTTLAASTAVAAILAGCGSSSTSSSPHRDRTGRYDTAGAPPNGGSAAVPGGTKAGGACAPGTVVTFCETIAITGAVQASGTGSAIPELAEFDPPEKCSAWVGHTPDGSDYPQLRAPVSAVGGHQLATTWKMPYQPGDYTFGATKEIDGYALNGQLTVDGTRYAVTGSGSTATATYTLGADGAGKLTFADLTDTTGKTISGTITWTCIDASGS